MSDGSYSSAVCGLSVFASTSALASSNTLPTITSTRSTFKVPAGKTVTWTLRLWSHGRAEGSDTGTSGVLTVAVPDLPGCTFQADVTEAAVGGKPQYYSGVRATMTSCGAPPPTQTIAGHIYLCAPGALPTTTEVAGGTLSASGPDTVSSQTNPLAATSVAAGTYTMTAGAPTGYLLTTCGGLATPASGGLTATESITLLSGGAEVGLFYVRGTARGRWWRLVRFDARWSHSDHLGPNGSRPARAGGHRRRARSHDDAGRRSQFPTGLHRTGCRTTPASRAHPSRSRFGSDGRIPETAINSAPRCPRRYRGPPSGRLMAMAASQAHRQRTVPKSSS